MLGKVGVWPSLMVGSPSSAPTPAALAQDAAKPHPHPTVEAPECGPVAVLEVLIPAPQGPVDVRDDLPEAVAVGAAGLGPYRVLDLPQAPLAGPAIAPLEVVAQEVEAAALSDATIQSEIANKTVRKVIVVKGRLVNIYLDELKRVLFATDFYQIKQINKHNKTI